jgi:hypothetical protein
MVQVNHPTAMAPLNSMAISKYESIAIDDPFPDHIEKIPPNGP